MVREGRKEEKKKLTFGAFEQMVFQSGTFHVAKTDRTHNSQRVEHIENKPGRKGDRRDGSWLTTMGAVVVLLQAKMQAVSAKHLKALGLDDRINERLAADRALKFFINWILIGIGERFFGDLVEERQS